MTSELNLWTRNRRLTNPLRALVAEEWAFNVDRDPRVDEVLASMWRVHQALRTFQTGVYTRGVAVQWGRANARSTEHQNLYGADEVPGFGRVSWTVRGVSPYVYTTFQVRGTEFTLVADESDPEVRMGVQFLDMTEDDAVSFLRAVTEAWTKGAFELIACTRENTPRREASDGSL